MVDVTTPNKPSSTRVLQTAAGTGTPPQTEPRMAEGPTVVCSSHAAEAVSKQLPRIRQSPDQSRPGLAAVIPEKPVSDAAKPHLVYIY